MHLRASTSIKIEITFMDSALPHFHSDDAPRLDLINGWSLLTDPTGTLKINDLEAASGWRRARVGVPWAVLYEDLRDYMGVAWYRTRFQSPQFSDARQVVLKFGAVDYFAEVFVNGLSVGTHEGGYTPFALDITHAVKPGMNDLAVRVIDPPMDEQLNQALCPEMMYNEIPHGKQNWYLQNGGIWQGVRVEFCPAIYIQQVHVTPNVSGDFGVEVQFAGQGLADSALCEQTSIQFSVYDSSHRLVFEDGIPSVIAAEQSFRGTVKNVRLWGPSEPNLYTLEVSLQGGLAYRKRVRFGFRKFEAKEGRLFLNDKPFYLIGALDQDFYPETIHTPASEEYVRDMMLKAKAIGINVLRCHLKVCHPVYLTIADELGMLLWCEMPSWSDCWYPADHFSLKAAERGRRMFEEMLVRDWNHPCIVIQTVMNESWGIDLKDATQRTWLKNTFNWIKECVRPLGRMVVDNSACEGNFHIKSDLEDFHNYYSMPDQVEKWEKFLSELAARPEWTYSPYSDAERSRHEPLLVSEFGNWGLPKLPEESPWWFNRDFGGREVTRPAGVLDRFQQYRFDTLFGDYNTMAEETQWHQFISLKYEIESMRRRGELQGYVITGMTDIHWEVNGLLDMWRNPKVFADELKKLQQPDLVMVDLSRQSFISGDKVELQTLVSHYSTRDLKGARVRWMTDAGAGGQFEISQMVPSGAVAGLEKIAFTAPQFLSSNFEHLHIEIRTRQGALIAENDYQFFILPKPQPAMDVPLHVHDPLGTMAGLKDSLRSAEYQADSRLTPEAMLISSQMDEATEKHLSGGGKALLLLDSEAGLPPRCELKVLQRAGCELDGRWFSNFNWVRTDREPFNHLDFGRILGFESVKVAPHYVIDGVPPGQFPSALAGVTFGWLARNMVLAVPFKWENGNVLATTFRFSDYGNDPYATHLLDGLIKSLASGNLSMLRLARDPVEVG
jgi:hypothetical protein